MININFKEVNFKMLLSVNKNRKNSYILTAIFFVVVCYFVISWFDLHGKIDEQQQNIAVIHGKYEAQEFENSELNRILESENDAEYFKRIARIDSGFVLPGERVYYDVSVGNN